MQLPAELENATAVLAAPSGATVYVLGMSHVSKDALAQIEQLISTVQPEIVLVEVRGEGGTGAPHWRCSQLTDGAPGHLEAPPQWNAITEITCKGASSFLIPLPCISPSAAPTRRGGNKFLSTANEIPPGLLNPRPRTQTFFLSFSAALQGSHRTAGRLKGPPSPALAQQPCLVPGDALWGGLAGGRGAGGPAQVPRQQPCERSRSGG